MTTQDAAKRAEAHRRLDAYKAGEFMGISQDRQVVDLMVAFADAAVAEAVRKSEMRGDRREAEMVEQRDLAYADGDRRVAEARREERERCAQIAENSVERTRPAMATSALATMRATADSIAAALRPPPASAPEGTYPKPAKIVGRREREPLRFDDEGTGGETK